VKEDNYFKVLKVALLPALATALWGIGMILMANYLAKIM
jgi:hypothetical protein